MFYRTNLSVTSGLLGLVSLVTAQPCDIYAAGNTPCVAAFSTTRALYSKYNGNLYHVKRGSDNATQVIKPKAAGGVANAATQDTFCQSTTCLITIIYDQSGRGNHLTQGTPGGAAHVYDNLAPATGAPVMVNGSKAYGVFIQPGTGYRQDKTSGIATYDQPEGMYAVLDGTHWNSNCCFDFGNVEVGDNLDNGPDMETLFLGGQVPYNGGYGTGSGPWIMSDQENGVFSGQNLGYNANDPTINYRFTVAIVKGEHNHWSIRGGNGVSGGLTTFYNGTRASGYETMSKEGGIVLGVGGDNSNGGQGTFYEGVMTSGYPNDNIEAYVQADIVQNAKYTTASQTSGAAVEPGSSVSMRSTSPLSSTSYIAHAVDGTAIHNVPITSLSSSAVKQAASWNVHPGLGNDACISFESKDVPGSFIRHSGSRLVIAYDDDTKQMHEDATFCPQTALNGQGNAIKSWNYPTKMVRTFLGEVYVADNGGPNPFDLPLDYNDEASFVVGPSLA